MTVSQKIIVPCQLMNTQVKVQKVHYVHTKTGKRVSFVDANNIINNSCFYQY